MWVVCRHVDGVDLHQAIQHLVGVTGSLKDLNDMLWEQGLLMMDHILKVQ